MGGTRCSAPRWPASSASTLGLEHELRHGLQRDEFSLALPARDRPRRRARSSASRRSCAGLADARHGVARPVHPRRRGDGPDHAARRVRRCARRASRPCAWRRTNSSTTASSPGSTSPAKQLSTGGIERARSHRRSPKRGLPATLPRPRGDRDGDRAGRRGGRAGAHRARGAALGRRPHRDRRLRHRLLVARAAAPVPDRRDQGRPLVHPGRRARPEGRDDHRERREPGARARARRRSPRASRPTASSPPLRELGCDLAQGYLFARAVPPAEIATMLGGETRQLREAA